MLELSAHGGRSREKRLRGGGGRAHSFFLPPLRPLESFLFFPMAMRGKYAGGPSLAGTQGARHSSALVRADGPEAWRLRPSAGTATSGDRLGGPGGARTLALPAALDVMPGEHVQDVHDLPVAKVGGQVACQDGAQHAAGWGGAHVPRALCRGRCDGRAVYGCFLCPLDTSPTPSSSCAAVEASRLRSAGWGATRAACV